MNELWKSFIENSSSFLVHYNHNHDKLGRFAKSNGSKGMSLMDHVYAAINKHDAGISGLKKNGPELSK